MISDIRIVKEEVLSDNRYILKKIDYEYTDDRGQRKTQSREVYERGNAATILLYNTETKTVVLTRQFRLPSFVNGNKDGMLVESCAGMLDKDNPEDCIRRETEEETGYRITKVKRVFDAYMSPGAVTEMLYFFVGEYSKGMKVNEGGGLEQEGENIEVLEVSIEEAAKMMDRGEIRDAKTIMLLQYAMIKKLIAS